MASYFQDRKVSEIGRQPAKRSLESSEFPTASSANGAALTCSLALASLSLAWAALLMNGRD